MWGILDEFDLDENGDGITPTHVGNTDELAQQGEREQDHPHTCGEYTKKSLIYQHFRLEKTANFITLTIKAYPTHI